MAAPHETTPTVATWNLAWSGPGSDRGRRIAAEMDHRRADIWVLTEGLVGSGSAEAGHWCDAGRDWGYPIRDAKRRKVLMWSRDPWRDIEQIEAPAPLGRLVAATTDTVLGPLRVVGVCVPWRDAHVTTGRRDRVRWEDHLAFLRVLGPFLAAQPRPVVLAGDLNQRLPPTRQPAEVYEALRDALGELRVVTAGADVDGLDHIAVSPDLAVTDAEVWPGVDDDGIVLSDHGGAAVGVGCRPATNRSEF